MNYFFTNTETMIRSITGNFMRLLKPFCLTSTILLFSLSCTSLAFKTNQPLMFGIPTYSKIFNNFVITYEIKCNKEQYNCSEIEDGFKRNIIERNIFKKVIISKPTMDSDYHFIIEYKTTFLSKPLSYTIALFSFTLIPVPVKIRYEMSFIIIKNEIPLKTFNYYRIGTSYFHIWSDFSDDKTLNSKINYDKMIDDIYNNFIMDFNYILKNQ